MEESSSEEICEIWPADYLRFRKRYLNPREDTLSKLPDSLISQILSFLPTKQAVQTSVLSKRWRILYLLIPALVLNANEFPNHISFVSFIDRFLDFSREHNSILHKLKLSVQKNVSDPPCVMRWIESASSSKLNHLDIECLVNRKFLEVIPQSLYVCDTLVYLRLHRVSLGELESVSLPCLKNMVLQHNVYANDSTLELLISSCPVIEDLSIVRVAPDMIKVLRVCSRSLTSLHIDYMFGEDDEYDDEGFERDGSGVYVDAPRLKYLKFDDDLSDSKIITNSASLATVNLVSVFSAKDTAGVIDLPKRDMVRNFFTSISGVTDMKLSSYIVAFLDYNSEFDPLVLPQFCNLSRLTMKILMACLDMLPTLLESCPNLNSLVLALDFYVKDEKEVEIKPSPVPQCLLSSLEYVEITNFSSGRPPRMEVARYFVKNSLVLKRLVLDIGCSTMAKGFHITEEGFYMLRDLLALPRPSSMCQILLK